MTFQEQSQGFVVESVSRINLCIMDDVSFFVNDPNEILSIIDINNSHKSEWDNSVYEIDSDQLSLLQSKYCFYLRISDDLFFRIRPRHWLDELSYKVHTGRELVLMLQGVKPLATFKIEYSDKPESTIFPERVFDQYVSEKKFVKHQYITKICTDIERFYSSEYRIVFYALKKEAWRINAFILLHQIAIKIGWNDGFERMEGALLGYQDWECDEYFSLMSKIGIRKPWSDANK